MSFVFFLSYGFVHDCVRLMGEGGKIISLTHNQVTNWEPRHMCMWETLLERARWREKEIPNSARSTFHIWLTVQSPSAINLSFKVSFWPSQRLSSHSPLSLSVFGEESLWIGAYLIQNHNRSGNEDEEEENKSAGPVMFKDICFVSKPSEHTERAF